MSITFYEDVKSTFGQVKRLIYILLALSFSTGIFAGNSDREKSVTKTISGKVTDAYGESIPGAKISITETGETFYADMDGNFKITVKADRDYSVSVNTIGYRPLQVKSVELTNFTSLTLKPL
jgi:hypothetical protein